MADIKTSKKRISGFNNPFYETSYEISYETFDKKNNITNLLSSSSSSSSSFIFYLLLFIALSSFLVLSVPYAVKAIPPISTEFYGNITDNNTLVSSSSLITAYDPDGIKCGQFIVQNQGRFGLLSCLGDDSWTSADEGAVSGDEITFFIDGLPTRRFFNYTWESGEFHFVSLDRNYPPVLTNPGNLSMYEDVLFSYQFLASDGNPEDVMSFSDNSSLFDISSSGLVYFTPTNDDVGTHSVNITVSDGFGLSDSIIINFTVINVNDRPFFDPPLEDQQARARTPFIYDINATDVDVGDVLTYYDNSSLFSIDPYTGMINFTPQDSDIGNHEIMITVCDDSGASDSCANETFTLSVLFANHPPVMTYIGNQEWYVGLPVYIDINATDEDNDSLLFYTNASFFSVNNLTGLLSFTPYSGLEGFYSVMFWVTDSNYNVSETVLISINPELYCGDGICSSRLISESCSTCPTDCGTCPPSKSDNPGEDTGGSSSSEDNADDTESDDEGDAGTESSLAKQEGMKAGSKGAAGAQGKQLTENICIPEWSCSDWSDCINGFQKRSCKDDNLCEQKKQEALKSGQFLKIKDIPRPEEERSCSPEPSCDDGIQNQDETGIDCGGPCTPCIIAPITKYVSFPFIERPFSSMCGDGICGFGEGCFCMQDCKEFPLFFFRFFSILFFVLLALLFGLNYILYKAGIYMKGRFLQRVWRIIGVLGFLFFILLVFSVYIWLYGSCPYILSRLIWLPLLVSIIVPLIIYQILLKLGYLEVRKIRKERSLLERHKDQLRMLERIERKNMVLVELDAAKQIFSLYQKKDELVRKFPALISLYNNLVRFAKHRVKDDRDVIDKDVVEELESLMNQKMFMDAIDSDERLKGLKNDLEKLREFFNDRIKEARAVNELGKILYSEERSELSKKK